MMLTPALPSPTSELPRQSRTLRTVSYQFYLYLAFCLAVLAGSWQWDVTQVAGGHQVIPQQAIRLRILANSDGDADQAVKRKVRDAVVASMNDWVLQLQGPVTIGQARAIIRDHMPILNKIVGQTLAENGFDYGYKVELGVVPFPDKIYGSRVYPAGDYEALRITLGRGAGQNWWCVLFPPLCFLNSDSGDAVPQSEVSGSGGHASDAAAKPVNGQASRGQAAEGSTGSAPGPGKAADGHAGTAASGKGNAGSDANGHKPAGTGRNGTAQSGAPGSGIVGRARTGTAAAGNHAQSGRSASAGSGYSAGHAGQGSNAAAAGTGRPQVRFFFWDLIQKLIAWLQR